MNPLLQAKYDELASAGDYECWYLVKQPTAFDSLCYLVSFLKEFQDANATGNLQEHIEKCVKNLQTTKPAIEISNNYRALRVAAFFGLITMRSKGYNDADITPTYDEIRARCGGEFERTAAYADIIDRQIEKIFLSSEIDEEKDGIRKDFRLYPVMLLYKVLLELGRTTGQYTIDMTEYRYLVATSKKYSDYLDALLLIRLMRQDPGSKEKFETYRAKFDNRLIQALKQLGTLTVDKDSVSLNPAALETVAHRVFVFENNPDIHTTEHYLTFLGSTNRLTDHNQTRTLQTTPPVYPYDHARIGAHNRIVYGTPGCGKSFYVQNTFLSACGVAKEHRVRTTFYMDYTNTDFVGQILPKVEQQGDKRIVTYAFHPGPFALALRMAIENPDHAVALIIEELNRGNAASIFGDIFQLLDRDQTGKSQYSITNTALQDYLNQQFDKKYVFDHIAIPSNLYIVATLNTSDQNVFTLDTAFKRRWQFEKLRNFFTADHSYKEYFIPGMEEMTWEQLVYAINTYIVMSGDALSSEDKQLGIYFIDEGSLCASKEECKNEQRIERFAYKLFEYLWDDVAKFARADWFQADIKTLDQLIDRYKKVGKKVFAEGVLGS